ncbi:hypothetical protein BBD42_03945 [Paenibacillus sp. BIHB 4019]|uniref:Uncharacterized protein n=1 Tax=Paenibacillus sp. BIHB 4019 TaxID=1870819 RepID=A0A1B2DDC4_9BACL|nr:hypothetical protein [Paenibacillus sp. BIHB 4019]ANY65709.1 hypothetical protein BBD42_03945 [Paenibacillus sp. BIHB 4019]
MENISTGLKWVIGVIVTILIIAAAVSIYLVINGYFNRAQEQTLAQTKLINQAEFSSYDNKDVSGQDVINASTRYSGRPQFSVYIDTGENRTGFYAKNNYTICYSIPTGSDLLVDLSTKACSYDTKRQVDVSTMQDQTNSVYYINTTAVFVSKTYKDKNGEVRLIEFSQK